MSRFKTKGKICTLFDNEEAAEISDEEQHPNEMEPNFDPYPSYTDEVYDEEDDCLDDADPYADINSNSWHKFKAPNFQNDVKTELVAGSVVNHLNEDNNTEFRTRNFVWYNRPNYCPKADDFPTAPPLTATLGMNVKNVGNPCEFFDHLIDAQIVDKLVAYTNKKLKPNEKPLTSIELRAVFGLLMLLGHVKKNDVDIETIWDPKSVHHIHWAAAAMSRDRFKTICCSICLEDVENRSTSAAAMSANDNLFKVEEILNTFRRNINGALVPASYLTVDEQFYPFKGQCPLVHYLSNKRYGLRFWLLSDVQTSYILDACIIGKFARHEQAQMVDKVLMQMTEPYYGTNRVITADGYFTNIDLVRSLWSRNLQFVGEIEESKPEIPNHFKHSKTRPKYSCAFGFNDYLTLASYVPNANKSNLVLSTHHHEARVIDDGLQTPLMVDLCQKTRSGGATRLDRLFEMFTCRRKTNKWSLVVIMYILDLASHDSFILAKMKYPDLFADTSRARRHYIEDVCIYLIRPLIGERFEQSAKSNFASFDRLAMDAFRRCGFLPESIVPSLPSTPVTPMSATGAVKRKRCGFCDRKTNKHDNKYSQFCQQCLTHVCNNHSDKLVTILCKRCSDKPID